MKSLGDAKSPFDLPEPIVPGSVLFLMGPPGTFKQQIATGFADLKRPEDPHTSTIYISFKADKGAVTVDEKRVEGKGGEGHVHSIRAAREIEWKGEGTYFLDARSPLLTPEEVLFSVRSAIKSRVVSFKRAVVWGLRRLSDLPNFAEGRSVQFLEALVTLLSSRGITSLLVDWPDIEKPSTLPIVDLSQYIFLTRVCPSPESPAAKQREKENPLLEIPSLLTGLWGTGDDRHEHVTLLRAQRTGRAFHRDVGVVLYRDHQHQIRMAHAPKPPGFEQCWLRAGTPWEQDAGLIN